MFFHAKKMDSLHEHIDPAHLPEDYGGKLPKISYSSVDWYPVLRDLDEDFKGKKKRKPFYFHDWNGHTICREYKVVFVNLIGKPIYEFERKTRRLGVVEMVDNR